MNGFRGTRTTRTARALAGLAALPLLAGTLAGCGETQADRGSDGAGGTPGASTSSPVVGGSSSEEASPSVALVSQSAGGGSRPTTTLTSVADRADLEAFLGDLSPGLAKQVRAKVDHAVTEVGETPYAAVVDVGCNPPTAGEVSVKGDQVVMTSTKATTKHVECFAPVTTVAVVGVPNQQ